MLRWILLAVLVVALTGGLTYLVQVVPPSTLSSGPAHPHTPKTEQVGPPGKAVVVGDPTYDFGTMGQDTTGKTSWVIRNEGTGNLTLRKGTTTCKCTLAKLGDSDEVTLKPGEETVFRLEWNPKENQGPFGQSAEVLTINDPDRQKLDFAVKGTVAPAIVLNPPGAAGLAAFPADEGTKYQVDVFSPAKDDLEITGLTSSKPDGLVATSRPLTPEECAALKTKSGYRVELEVKPGMPLGDLQEELLIRTNHPQKGEVRLPIVGRAIGPITVMPEVVRLATPGGNGADASVSLWVRGRESTNFEVVEVPGKLKVKVAPADDTTEKTDSAGKSRRYRLTVEVPQGTPPGLIGGQIVLKTDHPKAGEIRIPVNVKVLAVSR